MSSPSAWIDEIAERCHQQKEHQQIARELFQIAVRHRATVFEELIAQIRADLAYFRHRCPETDTLLEIASKPFDFDIWTVPPYNSRVHLVSHEAQITYRKEIRKNPRAEPSVSDGLIVIRANYAQSTWLELRGEPITYAEVAQFLVQDLFRTVTPPEQ